MKPRQWLAVGFLVGFFMILPMFLQTTPQKQDVEQINSPVTLINDSAVNVTNIQQTSYNVHYRLIGYQEVFSYTSVAYSSIIGIARLVVQGPSPPTPKSYRVAGLANGTLLVSNITNVMHTFEGQIYLESELVKGVTFQELPSFDIDTTDFEMQRMIEYEGLDAIVFGMNKTTKEAMGYYLRYNEVTLEFDYLHNYTILLPSLFGSINDLTTYDLFHSFGSTNFIASGKYINGTGNVPFCYAIDYFTGNVIKDYINLTTSTTNYHFYSDVVYAVRDSSSLGLIICTNKDMVEFSSGFGLAVKHDYPDIPLSSNLIFNFGFGIDEYPLFYFPYCFYDIASSTSGAFLVSFNWTYFNVKSDPFSFVLLNEMIDQDTLIKATTDLNDGVFFFGEDKNFDVWQTWAIGSGSISGGAFDLYMPIKIHKYPNYSYYKGGFELWFADSRGLWVAIFNLDDTGVIDVGHSNVNKIVSQRIDVKHEAGTDNFQYTVSGYLERITTDLVEIGIVPLFAMPTAIETAEPQMFSTRTTHEFINEENGGIFLRPTRTFIGTGGKITEFTVTFDAGYCPLLAFVFGSGFTLVPLQVQYVVYERYSNGTYTQKLLRTSFNSKSAFAQSSFILKTSISIQDSHMLDEIRVLSDGIEYNPYSLTFTKPDVMLKVIDKITNKTLFNKEVRFSDPLPVPIPAKYEFALRYFSSIDFFGLDFGLVNTYVNGTQVSTDIIRVLSPSARIITTDFANVTISDVTITKSINGQYINLPLPVATIIISNQYNFTITFFLTKGTTTISYSIPSESAILLRLALGNYRYIVTDDKGSEILDKRVTFSGSTSITIGEKAVLQFPFDPSAVQASAAEKIFFGIFGVIGAAAVGIVIAYTWAKRGQNKAKRKPWGI
jgi:hypothetical protein